MDGPSEEAVLAKDDPEEDFIDADDTIDERSEEEILKEILNRGGVPSRPRWFSVGIFKHNLGYKSHDLL